MAPRTCRPLSIRTQPPASSGTGGAIGGWLLFHASFESRETAGRVQAADPVKREPVPPPAPAPAPPPRLELKAIEPAWVDVYVDGKLTFAKLLVPEQIKSIEG